MSFNAANFKTSDQIHLAYQHGQHCESGVPAIFFCHGVGASDEQFETQQRFAEEYCVVIPTLRGHGASQKPEPVTLESVSLARLAADMLELADHLQIESFHFVGHQIGGLIGLELLKTAPERLLSLTICGVSPCAEKSMSAVWRQTKLLNAVGKHHIEHLLGLSNHKGYQSQVAFNRMVRTADRRAINYMLKHMEHPNYLATLESNKHVPVLVLRSAEDERVNEALDPCLERISALRTVDVIRVNSTGHLINMETPDYFNQILRAFLTKAGFKDSKPLSVPPELQQ